MMYLIGQLSIWLLLTMAFAALAGWAFAAERAAPAQRTLRRDRENLLRDLAKLASGDSGATSDVENEREADATRRLLEIRDGRIAELERVAEQARARADDAAGEVAELQRKLARHEETPAAEQAPPAEIVVAAELPEGDPLREAANADDAVLQEWRLRYFEQRVRYLETDARAVAAAPQTADPALEWRTRDAEARAAHLEQEVRRLSDAPAPAEAFASDADVDILLRWRLLYLERRVAHLQDVPRRPVSVTPQPLAAVMGDAGPDPDRWKWRSRYLEARVRHLEQRGAPAEPAAAVAVRVDPMPAAAPAPPPAPRSKPPLLPGARNGAPDDFTLIEGVSLQQQSTLYSLGVFHFDQIAAWTPEHVAWVDQYLRLRGRIDEEEWVEQADELAREGPAAARREQQDA